MGLSIYTAPARASSYGLSLWAFSAFHHTFPAPSPSLSLSFHAQFSLYISPPHVCTHASLSRQRITTITKRVPHARNRSRLQLQERACKDTHEQQSTVEMTSPPLIANEPFPPLTRLAGTSNRKMKKTEKNSRKKALGGI